METKEIMTNEDLIETTEEIINEGSGNGFKVAAGIGLTLLVGGVVYKYIAKPMIAKIKAKKESEEFEEVEEVDAEFVEEVAEVEYIEDVLNE